MCAWVGPPRLCVICLTTGSSVQQLELELVREPAREIQEDMDHDLQNHGGGGVGRCELSNNTIFLHMCVSAEFCCRSSIVVSCLSYFFCDAAAVSHLSVHHSYLPFLRAPRVLLLFPASCGHHLFVLKNSTMYIHKYIAPVSNFLGFLSYAKACRTVFFFPSLSVDWTPDQSNDEAQLVVHQATGGRGRGGRGGGGGGNRGGGGSASGGGGARHGDPHGVDSGDDSDRCEEGRCGRARAGVRACACVFAC